MVGAPGRAADTGGVTGRRLLAVLVACAALPVAPAGADVVLNPSGVFAVGSQPMQVAQQIALQQWGTNPCGGQIAIEPGRVNRVLYLLGATDCDQECRGMFASHA